MTDPIEIMSEAAWQARAATPFAQQYGPLEGWAACAMQEEVRAEERAIIAALDAAGWAIVPKEPEDAQIQAAFDATALEIGGEQGITPRERPEWADSKRISYRAMVEAGRVKP